MQALGILAFRWSVAVATASALLAHGAQASMPLASAESEHERATTCMATAIAYEAGNEPLAGQLAVAEVIVNRTRDPQYPKSICDVVYQGSDRPSGCQFSFACDGSLRRILSVRMMEKAHAVAEVALGPDYSPHVGGATHYHADYIAPRWASRLVRVTQIGRHIFYRQPNSGEAVLQLTTHPAPIPRPADLAYRFAPWGLIPAQDRKE